MCKQAASHDVDMTPWTIFKYGYSSVLLAFSIFMIMGVIGVKETQFAAIHPAVAYVAIWAAIIWLSMIEGSQASLVGLPPVDRELYKDSHPITYKITSFCHSGDNLDRYLMGRQFMVLLVVFVTNLSGSPKPTVNDNFFMPEVVNTIFLSTGFAMIILTANVGQLAAQVNASHCMIDYINNYFGVFTIYTALLIELSGIMHASYIIQIIVAALAGQPIVSKEAPRNLAQNIFFWGRCLMSTALLGFGFFITFKALADEQTTMWEGIPAIASIIIFFVLMGVVGMLEGMQIAFFAVAKLPKTEQGQNRFAKMTCKLLFRGNGQNLPGFMVGRQLCVVTCFFVVARITTLNIKVGEPTKDMIGNVAGKACYENGEWETGDLLEDLSDASGCTLQEPILFGSNGLQDFLNTGLHAAVITTIIGSISWQLVASAFPFMFLSNPLTYVLLRICLLFEATGLCCAAWVLASFHKKVAGYQYDEVYIGTPEERLSSGKGPEESVHVVAGSIAGAGFPKKPGAGGMRLGDYDNTVHGNAVTEEA